MLVKSLILVHHNLRQFCTKAKLHVKPEKLIRVAVIGTPNVGKSTLINELVEHRVCPVSRKVHTTRNYSRAFINRNQTQIVFYDTPGMITEREVKKHHLESSFLSAYRHSIQNADIIGVVHDISNSYTRNSLHESVISALEEYRKLPSFLVLNKIDTLKSKRTLLDLVRILTNGCINGVPYGTTKFSFKKARRIPVEAPKIEPNDKSWPNFQEIFMVSAQTGDGIFKIMKWLEGRGIEKPWIFEGEKHTDQTPEDLIVQTVQARLLDFMPQEIPYQLQSKLEFYDTDKGKIYASVLVVCPNERLEKLLCGVGNGKLKQITEWCTSDLLQTFQVPVSLTISTEPVIKAEKI